MKLVRPQTFINQIYGKGEMSAVTVRKRIDRKLIKGGFKEHGTYWIDMDVYLGRQIDMEIVALSECDELTMRALAL